MQLFFQLQIGLDNSMWTTKIWPVQSRDAGDILLSWPAVSGQRVGLCSRYIPAEWLGDHFVELAKFARSAADTTVGRSAHNRECPRKS